MKFFESKTRYASQSASFISPRQYFRSLEPTFSKVIARWTEPSIARWSLESIALPHNFSFEYGFTYFHWTVLKQVARSSVTLRFPIDRTARKVAVTAPWPTQFVIVCREKNVEQKSGRKTIDSTSVLPLKERERTNTFLNFFKNDNFARISL